MPNKCASSISVVTGLDAVAVRILPLSINVVPGLQIIVNGVLSNPLPLRFSTSKRPSRTNRGCDGITVVFKPERLSFLIGWLADGSPFKPLLDGSISQLDFFVIHTRELEDAICGIVNSPYRGVAHSLSLQAMVLYLMVEALRQAEPRLR